jgi:hypothetical protein
VAAQQLGLELVELVLELLDRPVDGHEAVGSGHPAAHVVPVPLEGDLADLLVGDPRVLLLREVDLGPVHAVEEPVEPADLLLGDPAKAIGNVGVPAAHGDIHHVHLPVAGSGTADGR